MKLQLSSAASQNLFTGYGEGYVAVNQQRYEQSLVVLPDRIMEDWMVDGFEELAAVHFEFLAHLEFEVLLLGTGSRMRFPSPLLTMPLGLERKGMEIMDTFAACRTYNILTAEGRKVAAAILVP